MPEEQDPPRKFYGLKETEFDAVNKRADHRASIDVKDLFRQAAATGTAKPPGLPAGPDQNTLSSPASSLSGIPERPKPPGENDVHGILQANLARANAAGLNELAEKPRRPSLRKRDYWLLMVGGNGFFVTAGLLQGGVVLVFAGAGIILFTVGVTWVMWFVMDDY